MEDCRFRSIRLSRSANLRIEVPEIALLAHESLLHRWRSAIAFCSRFVDLGHECCGVDFSFAIMLLCPNKKVELAISFTKKVHAAGAMSASENSSTVSFLVEH